MPNRTIYAFNHLAHPFNHPAMTKERLDKGNEIQLRITYTKEMIDGLNVKIEEDDPKFKSYHEWAICRLNQRLISLQKQFDEL